MALEQPESGSLDVGQRAVALKRVGVCIAKLGHQEAQLNQVGRQAEQGVQLVTCLSHCVQQVRQRQNVGGLQEHGHLGTGSEPEEAAQRSRGHVGVEHEHGRGLDLGPMSFDGGLVDGAHCVQVGYHVLALAVVGVDEHEREAAGSRCRPVSCRVDYPQLARPEADAGQIGARKLGQLVASERTDQARLVPEQVQAASQVLADATQRQVRFTGIGYT